VLAHSPVSHSARVNELSDVNEIARLLPGDQNHQRLIREMIQKNPKRSSNAVDTLSAVLGFATKNFTPALPSYGGTTPVCHSQIGSTLSL